jgi:hypothetical protein
MWLIKGLRARPLGTQSELGGLGVGLPVSTGFGACDALPLAPGSASDGAGSVLVVTLAVAVVDPALGSSGMSVLGSLLVGLGGAPLLWGAFVLAIGAAVPVVLVPPFEGWAGPRGAGTVLEGGAGVAPSMLGAIAPGVPVAVSCGVVTEGEAVSLGLPCSLHASEHSDRAVSVR